MLYSELIPYAHKFYRITTVFNQNQIRNEYNTKTKCQLQYNSGYKYHSKTGFHLLFFLGFFNLTHLQRPGELREGLSVHVQFNNPDSKTILKLSKRFNHALDCKYMDTSSRLFCHSRITISIWIAVEGKHKNLFIAKCI